MNKCDWENSLSPPLTFNPGPCQEYRFSLDQLCNYYTMFGVIKSIPRGASRLQLTAKKGHNFYKGKSLQKSQHVDICRA